MMCLVERVVPKDYADDRYEFSYRAQHNNTRRHVVLNRDFIYEGFCKNV